MATFLQRTPAAKVTEKATGNVYFLYRVASTSEPGTSHYVWVRNGLACHCSCNSRKYNSGQACKHMKNFNEELDQAPATFPGKTCQDVAPTACLLVLPGRKRTTKRDQKTPAGKLATKPPVAPKVAARREYAPLNGNREFSLMRR